MASQIEQLQVLFDKMDVKKKKQFIIELNQKLQNNPNLKHKLQSNTNAEYKKFLAYCIQQYNMEIRNSSSASVPMSTAHISNVSIDKKKNPLMGIVIFLSIAVAITLIGGGVFVFSSLNKANTPTIASNVVNYTTPDTATVLNEAETSDEVYISTIYESDWVYTGEIKNGIPHGEGHYIFNDGAEYIGEVVDGVRHGKGHFMLPDGTEYMGEFKDGFPNGEGHFTFSNGAEYTGEVKNGVIYGKGIFAFPDGSEYTGEVIDGVRHGEGHFKFPNGAEYTGEFKDDNPHGEGYYISPDGTEYTGKFKDGLPNGKGHYKFSDGEEYTGEVKDDFPHGEGYMTKEEEIILYDINTGDINSIYFAVVEYEGVFNNGYFEKGVIRKDGLLFYEGEVSNWIFNGKGKLYNDDGKTITYEGDFLNGRSHGQGRYYYENGSYYEGEFSNGAITGNGIYY